MSARHCCWLWAGVSILLTVVFNSIEAVLGSLFIASVWQAVSYVEDRLLREYFAGQALAGIMARLDPSGFDIGVDLDDWSCPAGDAYAVADAMLSHRQQGEG